MCQLLEYSPRIGRAKKRQTGAGNCLGPEDFRVSVLLHRSIIEFFKETVWPGLRVRPLLLMGGFSLIAEAAVQRRPSSRKSKLRSPGMDWIRHKHDTHCDIIISCLFSLRYH